MRLGVLDVGSNTVHLLVVDAHRGAQPTPQHTRKSVLRLWEHIRKRGDLDLAGADALVGAALGGGPGGQGTRLRRAVRLRYVGRARGAELGRGARTGARRRPASTWRCCPARMRLG